MTDFQAWEIWLQSNAVLILALIGIGLGALVKLSLMVWNQHQALEKSELSRVVDKIDELVTQIQVLFKKQDNTLDEISDIKRTVATLDKNHCATNVLCVERGKIISDIKERQDRLDSIILNHKSLRGDTHVLINDRTDREN